MELLRGFFLFFFLFFLLLHAEVKLLERVVCSQTSRLCVSVPGLLLLLAPGRPPITHPGRGTGALLPAAKLQIKPKT